MLDCHECYDEFWVPGKPTTFFWTDIWLGTATVAPSITTEMIHEKK